MTHHVRFRWLAMMVVAAIHLGGSSVAQAQPIDAGLAAQRRLYEEGNALLDAEKLGEAEAKYLEAWQIRKSFDLAGNLGIVELKRGESARAAEHLAYAMREFPAGGSPALRTKLAARLAEAKSQAVTLRIRVSTAGAIVDVDGRAVGPAPIADEVYVDPGSHLVRATFEGLGTSQQSVSGERGAAVDVVLVIASSRPSLAPVWIGAGVTAAFLGVGIVGTVVASSKASDADKLAASIPAGGCAGSSPNGGCAKLKSLNQSSDTFHNIGVVGYVGAGAAAVGTVVTYFVVTSKRSSPSPSAGLVPWVGVHDGGLAVRGVF